MGTVGVMYVLGTGYSTRNVCTSEWIEWALCKYLRLDKVNFIYVHENGYSGCNVST